MCCLWLSYAEQLFIVKILCMLPIIIAKLHIANRHFEGVDTLAEATVELYQHVLFVLCGIKTQPQIASIYIYLSFKEY